MAVKTDAWVVHAGEKGAPPKPTELVRETFEFADPGPDEALVSPLYGCMEGNMGHVLDRRPIDICVARGEPKCVVGNAGVVRVEKAGPECKTVKDGNYAYRIEALRDGKSVSATGYQVGTVTGIAVAGKEPTVIVNGLSEVRFADVKRIE